MIVDQPAAPPCPISSDVGAFAPVKVRLRFRKCDDLRFLSHHDLMRTFERMLRRAEIPFRRTQGFHPKPRLVFALSLPLGVVGLQEVAELVLDRAIPLDELHDHLVRQAPAGLTILSLQLVPWKSSAQVHRLCYRMPLRTEQTAAVRERAAALMAAPECWIERTRPPARRLDVRPFLHALRVVELDGQSALEMDLYLKPNGTARPEEIVRLLGLPDPNESGTMLERCRLELEDEIPPPLSADVVQLTATAYAEASLSQKVSHEEGNAD